MEGKVYDACEKRARRVPVARRIRLSKGGHYIKACSVNISDTGLLIGSVVPLLVEEFLIIEMEQRPSGFHVVNYGIVVRKVDHGDDFYYGISFVEFPPVSHCMTTDLNFYDLSL